MPENFRNIQPKSFENQQYFPGCTGNPFDRFLHVALKLEKIPSIVFFIPLVIVSFFLGRQFLLQSSIIFLFYLFDFFLLLGLPILKISFGPIKPTFLLLSILRSIFWLLPFYISIWFQLIGILLILYCFYFEPTHLTVTRQDIQSTKILPGTHIRCLHLGDLHLEQMTHRENAILNEIRVLKPDLIFFTGDLLNLSFLEDPEAQEAVHRFLQQLSAPLGVYGVSGSPAVDLPALFPKLVENTPLIWLNDQQTEITSGQNQLIITGLTCTHHPDPDFARLQQILTTPPDHFSILLYHTPDLAPLSCSLGFDLQLSGHTHGGQVRLPLFGAIFDGSLYPGKFDSGRYRLQQMVLYVTRGIGLEGAAAPRIRFLCPPEITLWDIHS